ncbi:MAG: hypothetical protein KF758_07595 [Anaerolineales bacterium]|nr:hypothetical protein [Anaerolineales bacterium]
MKKSPELTPQERMTNNRLKRWKRQDIAKKLLPKERVAKCFRVPIKIFIRVLKSKQFNRARYDGTTIVICGSVWHCPVCASKITEYRRKELQAAIDKSKEMGLSVFLVTFTLQHTNKDKLIDVRTYLGDALRKTKSGGWNQRFIKKFQIIGNVTSTEVTHGFEFGWHFHKHILYFSKRKIQENERAEIENLISLRYRQKIFELGRYAHPIHGVNVKIGYSNIADYVAKYGHEKKSDWSLAAEITKSFSKNSENITAFELLDYENNTDKENLYREYAEAMKGARQLRWSPGLRKFFQLGKEVSDKEIAGSQDDDAFTYADILRNQWFSKILPLRKRGELLEVASNFPPDVFQTWIHSLKRRP